MNKNSLSGRRILITRARGQSRDFAIQLGSVGAEVVEFPTIEMVPPLHWGEVDRAMDQLNSYDWIIFTSANGVDFFWQRMMDRGRNPRFPSSLKVCAIGPATADRLRKKRASVHYIPKEFIAESILEGFEKMAVQGKRILLARAKKARDILPKGLKKIGAEVDVVAVYRTVRPKGGSKKLKRLLAEGKIDAVAFTSSSTVNHFAELLKKEDLKELMRRIAVACIGPVTANTAKKWGMKVKIQPGQFTIPGLTRAIADYYQRRSIG